ncbi:MAG: M48 family metallopeptidase [Deltaproteobacteria bacterium]|nr:M48 family metallopeptidase [Deltaproteobacteria bacterium]
MAETLEPPRTHGKKTLPAGANGVTVKKIPLRQRGATYLFLVLFLALSGCVKAPYTERAQFIIISEPEEAELGVTTFGEIKKKSSLVSSAPDLDIIKRVGGRIADAAYKPEYRWEFILINDKAVNAFALPGGKVAFYTGILPVTKDEAGVAVVMGHEVAHVLARHGAERLSQREVMAIGQTALMAAIAGKSPAAQDALLGAYGVGAQVGVMLPFSRTQESEADKIGLILMAKAGYDPRAAVLFWKRMDELFGGKARPELLSTHPNDQRRIKEIEDFLPVAMDIYRQSASGKTER